MSIIYDALQKTQRNREYLRIQASIVSRKQKPQRFYLKSVLLALFALLAGLGAGALVAVCVKPSLMPWKFKSFYVLQHIKSQSDTVKAKVPLLASVQSSQAPKTQPSTTAKVSVQPTQASTAAQPSTTEMVSVQPAQASTEAQSNTTEMVSMQPVQASTTTPFNTTLAAVSQAPSAMPHSQPLAKAVSPIITPPVFPAAPQLQRPGNEDQDLRNKLNINGVLISGTEKIALINNQSYHVGDIISGMRIIEINLNTIKLQSEHSVVELRI